MMKNAVLGCGEGPWETKSCLRGKPLQHAPWPWAPSWGDHHNIIVASDVDDACVGGDDIFGLMVMIIGKKVGSDDDDDDNDEATIYE